MRPEAEAWWELAEDDFAVAQSSLKTGHFHIAAFLAQQAAERALKALWIVRRKEMAPKTHNLQDLAEAFGVLERFEGVHFASRPVELYKYWQGHPGVELLCYTPEEFERKKEQISIVREAVREGIEL